MSAREKCPSASIILNLSPQQGPCRLINGYAFLLGDLLELFVYDRTDFFVLHKRLAGVKIRSSCQNN